MIKKRNSYPVRLFGLEALARRLKSADELKSRIEEEVRIARAGVNGEKTLASVFDKYSFSNPHYVFHDLNLKSTGAFQIDTLFLSLQGATILEVKNIAGKIHFPSEQNQMMRTLDNGLIDAFECPSIQLERNKILLEDWFRSIDFKIPIHTAVVFSSARQRFTNSRDHLKVLFPLEVPVYLHELLAKPHFLDIPTINKIADKLVTGHQEYNPFPLIEKYNFSVDQIIKGVRCHHCGLHCMSAISTGWYCKMCNHVSKDAHRKAILEYFMLFGGNLTNQSCRDFLLLKSSDKAKRIMKQMNLSYRGVNRGRTYYLPLYKLKKELELLTVSSSKELIR